jgi:hypothetical protein
MGRDSVVSPSWRRARFAFGSYYCVSLSCYLNINSAICISNPCT